ncbi:cyclin-D1-1 [Olea europaea subsp. europaea]|uniref:Cyclin-D1-1 n=1 Tax=Olea europaea subsp. europaea TaxID=158383 RepID=A0A8S0PAH2_OLEEU|nr:cyclin-D1-1 [Olea europaea subsp. europaea]
MSVSCSDLLCGEDSSIIFSTGGEALLECSSDQGFLMPEVEESIAGLIENERNFMVPCNDYIEKFHLTQSIDASNRADSVAWILKVHRYHGFQPLTAYLSVNYFDRFLYSHQLPKMNGWPAQLLSVACLSLAAKVEEPLVPSLLDLQVEGAQFIFEPRNIQRMELLVLRVLDWRLQSISPFSFLSFFAHKIDPTGNYTGFLTSRATEIILSNIQETNFLEYRPSCIAAATILCAANDLPHFSLVTAQHAESWCDGLHKDKITSCRQLMQQTAFANRPRKQPKVLPQLRVMTRASIAWSDSSSTSFSSSSPYKRRKLNNSLWLDNDK